MPRLVFFAFAAAFCLAASLPLRSRRDASWTQIAWSMGGEGETSQIVVDRDYDFPTGTLCVEVPVWALDVALFTGALLAFAAYAQTVIRERSRQAMPSLTP